MKSIEKEALKKTVVAVNEIKDYNDKIEELNKLKLEIYYNKALSLIHLLEEQVAQDIKDCTSPYHMFSLLSIKQMIRSDGLWNGYALMPKVCTITDFINKLIHWFNDITEVPTDFMAEHKEIYTIYTCMVNLELEFRKE